MDFKQNHFGSYKTKAATFSPKLPMEKKNPFFVFGTVLFNIFTSQTLTNDFGGLHKNYELHVSFKETMNEGLFLLGKSLHCSKLRRATLSRLFCLI